MKQKYIFNSKTLQYTAHSRTLKQRLYKCLLSTTLILVCSGFLCILISESKFAPTAFFLEYKNKRLVNDLKKIENTLDSEFFSLSKIEEKDELIYRVYAGMPSISFAVRQSGTGGIDKYRKYNIFSEGDLMKRVAQKADVLESQIKIQQISFDEIKDAIHYKNKRHAAIPAICPLMNNDYIRISDYFGNRFHPVLKTHKMHTGLDYAANIGTPVYATGDGIVAETGWDAGYGNRILVEHGFGYSSVYAHLSKMTVRKGDKINRGKLVGLVGNTGISTGPHLHYEIRKENVPVNPMLYYGNDLSDAEYKKIAHK